jgi:hypothetical protein
MQITIEENHTIHNSNKDSTLCATLCTVICIQTSCCYRLEIVCGSRVQEFYSVHGKEGSTSLNIPTNGQAFHIVAIRLKPALMHVALNSTGVIRRMFRIDYFTPSMLEMRFRFSSHNLDISK